MFNFRIFKKDKDKEKEKENKKEKDNDVLRKDLGSDFYLEYDEVSNGIGGYHPVNIVLKNYKDKKCNYAITDDFGNFVNFPGAIKGNWENELDGAFYATVQYTFSVSKFVNGISYVIWLVQPDGMYSADEDGFGAEDYSEIRLYSMMNTKGEFLIPFTYERLEGCGNCYML